MSSPGTVFMKFIGLKDNSVGHDVTDINFIEKWSRKIKSMRCKHKSRHMAEQDMV